nr:hypothetical protein Iba_chr04cCG15130 [Ipomoea batatas]
MLVPDEINKAHKFNYGLNFETHKDAHGKHKRRAEEGGPPPDRRERIVSLGDEKIFWEWQSWPVEKQFEWRGEPFTCLTVEKQDINLSSAPLSEMGVFRTKCRVSREDSLVMVRVEVETNPRTLELVLVVTLAQQVV